MGKSSKACPIEIDRQWIIGGTKGVDPHIEFPSSEQKRVQQVSLDNIGLRRVILIEGLPSGDICYFIEDEDAFSLAFGGLSHGAFTGFMIQSILLSFCVLLNSSKKMTYSPGSWKVGGRKSY